MKTKKRPGRVPKDVEISNGFNQMKIYETDADARRRILLEKRRLYRQAYRKAAKEKAGIKEKVLEENAEDDTRDADDMTSAQRMLQDLRYAYRNSVGAGGKRGKQRLVALMESDAEFKFAVKELMKIEIALMTAKARKNEDPGGQGQQNVFVILKGLEDEDKYLVAGGSDKTVDMKQIQRAMNPDGSEYEVDRKEKDVR